MIVCKLVDILTERGMSRRELARRSRLNINTVCKLAKDDHRMIDRLTLDRVCAVLHITPGELLTWEPDQEPASG
jgi:DNA-binding Xre family transcriptional regulator